MTQNQLILEWIAEHGQITPAKMSGRLYKGEIFGSETSKRCRELRNMLKLESRKKGKFQEFYLKPRIIPLASVENPIRFRAYEKERHSAAKRLKT